MYSIFFPSTRPQRAARVRTRAYRLPALSRLLLPPPDLRRFFLPPPALRFAPSPLAPPPSNSELAELPTVGQALMAIRFFCIFLQIPYQPLLWYARTPSTSRSHRVEARRWRVDRSSPSRSLATDELPTTRERQLRAPFDAGEDFGVWSLARFNVFITTSHIHIHTASGRTSPLLMGACARLRTACVIITSLNRSPSEPERG